MHLIEVKSKKEENDWIAFPAKLYKSDPNFIRAIDQEIKDVFDSEKNSEDYKTLAYVFLLEDDTFVNAEILRQGFAFLSIRPPNMKYAKELREAYKEARAEQRGLQGH